MGTTAFLGHIDGKGRDPAPCQGTGAPAGTPPDVIERLNREINAGLKDPAVKTRLEELGNTPMIFTPAEFAAFVAQETEQWARAVRFSGVRMG